MAATNPDLPKTGYHASYSALVRTSRTAAGPARRPASTHAWGMDAAIQVRTDATTSSIDASDATESSPSALSWVEVKIVSGSVISSSA